MPKLLSAWDKQDFCPESISKSDAFSLLRSWDSLKHRWLPLSFLSSGSVSCRGHLVTRHLCGTLLSGYIEWSTWGKGTYFTPYFILLNPRTCGREEFSTPVVDSKTVSTTCPHSLPQLSLGASLWFVDILYSQSSPEYPVSRLQKWPKMPQLPSQHPPSPDLLEGAGFSSVLGWWASAALLYLLSKPKSDPRWFWKDKNEERMKRYLKELWCRIALFSFIWQIFIERLPCFRHLASCQVHIDE